ncbi:hypothetical protein NEOLEDRAFT_1171178 [Neolentinus lepideus HHB14362 ss-1]|uniref:Novel STAND NTPase 1 domain-containing protein n=1 Tax=Neolentinus lepideus HHB14362 ss-1 TaxID=1314782 RepID=A0A165QR09_9AGAM|nr:hypothetical protein NEOLEDRAFT_1171178 [Neolentinus lepideus HHB14362 ss-1]
MAPARDSSSKTAATLGVLRDALMVVANVADGGISVPFVKGSAQIAIQLIDAAQVVKSNKDDCRDVAQRAAETMLGLAKTLTRLDPECDKLSDELKIQLEEFQIKLNDIRQVMQDLADRGRLRRFVKRNVDQGTIAGWKTYLDDARRQFVESSLIDIVVGQVEIIKKLDILESGIQNTNMSALTQDQIMESPLLSRTIPAKPAVFLGRDQDIEKALNTLTSQIDPQAHLAVLGPGGMGKTSFALTLLHHPTIKDHFKQHVYFVPCESANSCDQLLFYITSVLAIKKQDGEDILTSMDTFLRRGPRLLVVLDNFETPYDQKGSNQNIVDVLGRISSVRQVSLVVTMRGTIAPMGMSQVKIIKLGSLNPEASKQAFLAISPETEEQNALEELLEEVDHIPLAVTLIANLAKLDSVESLLQEWREKKTALLADGSNRLNNIEVSIGLSLKVKAIQEAPDALSLLALISYLPDGILMAQETLEAKTPHMKARKQALRALRQVALIQEHEGSINVLSPIRHYICKQHPLGQIHRQAIETYYTVLISKYDWDYKTAKPQISPPSSRTAATLGLQLWIS